jgi:hypothetical protein
MKRETDAKICPTCKKGHECERDKYGWMKTIKCQDRFHIWYCNNNYTRYGCHGHRPGDLRCMDLG